MFSRLTGGKIGFTHRAKSVPAVYPHRLNLPACLIKTPWAIEPAVAREDKASPFHFRRRVVNDILKAIKALFKARILSLKVDFLLFQNRILLPEDDDLRFKQGRLTFQLCELILDQAQMLFKDLRRPMLGDEPVEKV